MGNSTSKESVELISESLRTHRTDKGWSQLELANRAGIDRKTVNRIENDRFMPSVETLMSLSKALEIPIANLLGEK